jgi:hypothetical protein
MGASVFRLAATGTGPLAETFAVPVGDTYRVLSAMLNLNTAASDSENFTITLDAVDGANHDTLIYSLDPSASSVVDVVWQPDAPLYLIGGDSLDLAWANTGGRTWGLLVTMEVV